MSEVNNILDMDGAKSAAALFNEAVTRLLQDGWSEPADSLQRWYWWRHPDSEGTSSIAVAYWKSLCWAVVRCGQKLPGADALTAERDGLLEKLRALEVFVTTDKYAARENVLAMIRAALSARDGAGGGG